MEGKTIQNGKYPNVLQTFCITKTAKTVLCNALYFGGGVLESHCRNDAELSIENLTHISRKKKARRYTFISRKERARFYVFYYMKPAYPSRIKTPLS